MGLRSGTLAPANIVGMSKALGLATDERDEHVRHIRSLRDHFAELLFRNLEDLRLNGPDLSSDHRLPGNLNLSLDRIEGEAWVIATPEVAFSSGSACSHVDATSSHVIQALGQSESEARRSARFGLSRFTTREEIERAAEALIASYKRLTRA
jgi:cysteine desulfurase